MELEIGLFVTGFVLGAGLIWILVDKRVTGTIDDMERNYETRIANLTNEVRNADSDHNETRQRLIAAEMRTAEIEAELDQLKRTNAANQERALAVKEALVASRPPEPEPVAVPEVVAPQATSADQTRRRIKALEAKRAMLPAGSNGRRAIEAEIASLRG